jgi:hypothetical protein
MSGRTAWMLRLARGFIKFYSIGEIAFCEYA